VNGALPASTRAARLRFARCALPPLVRFAIRRLAIGVGLALAVSVLVFLGTQVLPGDAATAVLGRGATPQSVRILRHQLGLDKPVPVQYLHWLGKFVRGDLGTSLTSHESVAGRIGSRIGDTAALGAVTLALVFPLAMGLGLLAALRRGRLIDHVISHTTLGLIALPEFVTGALLTYLIAIKAHLLPPVSLVAPGASPFSQPKLLVLPGLTLAFSLLAYNVRMVRAGVGEVLGADYVQSARLNGMRERTVITRFVLRNSLAPSVQVFALTAQWLLGGVVIVETIFQFPGLGQGLVQAVAARDIPTVQAMAMVLAAIYIGLNILADLLVVVLVPKLRPSA
jgi:peptide/nickel transport system permease protein